LSFEGSPYEINILVNTFPIGGGSVSFPADSQKLTSLTSEDIGILESYIIVSIRQCAGYIHIGGCDEKRDEPTAFTESKKPISIYALTK